jgi:hypothetical protein
MKDFFASIYETLFGIYNSSYQLIFDTLYDNNVYFWFVIISLVIPLIACVIFYYSYKNPYATLFNWALFMGSSIVIALMITSALASYEIYASSASLIKELNNPSSTYQNYASLLPLKYALVNFLLAAFSCIIFSLIFKQRSKVQTHLPI